MYVFRKGLSNLELLHNTLELASYKPRRGFQYRPDVFETRLPIGAWLPGAWAESVEFRCGLLLQPCRSVAGVFQRLHSRR